MDHKKKIYKIITDIWQWLKKYSDLTQADSWDEADEALINIYEDNADCGMYDRFTRAIACAAWALIDELSKEREEK